MGSERVYWSSMVCHTMPGPCCFSNCLFLLTWCAASVAAGRRSCCCRLAIELGLAVGFWRGGAYMAIPLFSTKGGLQSHHIRSFAWTRLTHLRCTRYVCLCVLSCALWMGGVRYQCRPK